MLALNWFGDEANSERKWKKEGLPTVADCEAIWCFDSFWFHTSVIIYLSSLIFVWPTHVFLHFFVISCSCVSLVFFDTALGAELAGLLKAFHRSKLTTETRDDSRWLETSPDSKSMHMLYVAERSLEVKLPTIWTDGKAEVGRVRERRATERRSEKRKNQKKEDAGARRGRKVAKHCVFPLICGSGRSKSRLGRRALARWEIKSCTPLWREARVEVKMYKTPHIRSTLGSWDFEKMHAVVARSTKLVKMYKAHHARTTSGSWYVEKVYAVGARSTFQSQKC